MQMSTAIIASSFRIIGLMSLHEGSNEVRKGPRVVRPVIIWEDQTRTQQSRARLEALRGALLQQTARLRAKSANGSLVLPT
jgi:hypothetical protein